jgi:hypothetical protein
MTLSACATESSTSGYYGYNESCASNGDQVAGAVVGGGIGALAGSAIAGRGNRTPGAVLGGVAGAVAGAEIAKSRSNSNCANGYYDNAGRRVYYDEYGRPYYR